MGVWVVRDGEDGRFWSDLSISFFIGGLGFWSGGRREGGLGKRRLILKCGFLDIKGVLLILYGFWYLF